MNTICYDEQTRRSMKREATARRYGLKVEAADSCRSLLRLEPFAIQFAKYFSFCTHLQRAQLLLGWCSSCSVGAALARLVHLRQVHPLSVPPFAFAVRSVSVRRPIGFRPPSDRFPFAVGGKVLGKTLQERCAQRQYYRRLRHLLRERISLFLLSAP